MNQASGNKLRQFALATLFISSYLPLFVMLILKQLFTNYRYLSWGGFSKEAINIFFQKFGLSFVLILVVIVGYVGYRITFSNIAKGAENGSIVTLKDVKNKNSEAIGYIATYIIPFLFQSFDSYYEMLSVLFLLFIIYRIYINSNMILINPVLSMRYALFEIDYEMNGKKCNGLAVSSKKYLEEDAPIKLYEIGHKLFYLT